MSRPSKHQWAMELAQVTAKRATCLRRQVGCVLLNARGHILATGYNGVAAGLKHCNEARRHPDLDTKGPAGIVPVVTFPYACPGSDSLSGVNLDGCYAIHAEQNALLQCRDVHQIYTCYTTTAPCITCTKLLLNTSCRRIIFLEDHKQWSELSGDLWYKAGRSLTKLTLATAPDKP